MYCFLNFYFSSHLAINFIFKKFKMHKRKSVNMNKPKQDSITSNSLEGTVSPKINQKKTRSSSNSVKKERKNIYLTPYMQNVIKKDQDNSYFCNLCPDKPKLKRKSIYRHLTESSRHALAISKETNVKGHEELLPLVLEAELFKIRLSKSFLFSNEIFR